MNIHWLIKKAQEFQKNIYSCFIDYAKALDCADHDKLWKILKEMGNQTLPPENLYAGEEASVRTGQEQQFSPVAESCSTLIDTVGCSMPGHPVHHQLLEFIQTQVHRVSDAIQPSPPLSSPSPTFNLSQHQGLFK